MMDVTRTACGTQDTKLIVAAVGVGLLGVLLAYVAIVEMWVAETSVAAITAKARYLAVENAVLRDLLDRSDAAFDAAPSRVDRVKEAP